MDCESVVCVCVHLHGDVVSGGQLLADSSQRSLVHLSDAAIQHLNGIVTLSLTRSLLSVHTDQTSQTCFLYLTLQVVTL